MKYTEKKARAFQKKHGLSEITVKVWKSRNHIPDKYFKRGYTRPVKANTKDLKRMEKVLKLEPVRRAAFSCMPAHRMGDFLRGGGNAAITVKETKAFYKEVDKLSKNLSSYLKKPSQDKLYNLFEKNKTLKASLLIKNNKVYDRFRKGYTLQDKEVVKIAKNIERFQKKLG